MWFMVSVQMNMMAVAATVPRDKLMGTLARKQAKAIHQTKEFMNVAEFLFWGLK